jgi:poly(A) polymerase
MPIITPAYPSMCATHNITMSTMKIIQRELKRAGSITDKIMSGKAAWRDLFVKHTFFTQGYKYYLSIIAASTSKEANKKWSGCVESKVRLLVASLEGHESIALGHPFNKGFSRVHRCATDEEIEKAKSGSLGYQISETATEPNDSEGKVIVNADAENGEKEVSGAINSTMVFTSTFYIGLELREGK